jgi:hypothetical protein
LCKNNFATSSLAETKFLLLRRTSDKNIMSDLSFVMPYILSCWLIFELLLMFNELQLIAENDTGSPLNSSIVKIKIKRDTGVGVQRFFFFALLQGHILLRLIPLPLHIGAGVSVGILTGILMFFPTGVSAVAPRV